VIDSAVDEAREIFEYKDDIKNETVEEETSTEEFQKKQLKKLISTAMHHSMRLAKNWKTTY
jgi:hypothetical protein